MVPAARPVLSRPAPGSGAQPAPDRGPVPAQSGSDAHNVNASPGSRAAHGGHRAASGLRVSTPLIGGVLTRNPQDATADVRFVGFWRIGCVVTITRDPTDPYSAGRCPQSA